MSDFKLDLNDCLKNVKKHNEKADELNKGIGADDTTIANRHVTLSEVVSATLLDKMKESGE